MDVSPLSQKRRGVQTDLIGSLTVGISLRKHCIVDANKNISLDGDSTALIPSTSTEGSHVEKLARSRLDSPSCKIETRVGSERMKPNGDRNNMHCF